MGSKLGKVIRLTKKIKINKINSFFLKCLR